MEERVLLTIGQRVRAARVGRGLSLRSFAVDLRVSLATLSALASWRRCPPLVLDPPLAGALTAFLELDYGGASMRDIDHHAGCRSRVPTTTTPASSRCCCRYST